jgi:hypothetical protein
MLVNSKYNYDMYDTIPCQGHQLTREAHTNHNVFPVGMCVEDEIGIWGTLEED